MAPEIVIGDLVKRASTGEKTHRVESVIAGDVITSCGRRMKPLNAKGRKLQIVVLNMGTPADCAFCW